MAAEVSKIQDYAIIGDGRSAALISKHGSIDWLCWPRFDSASIFGAMIDPGTGGHWSIHPADDSNVSRRYIENTNVLETTFSNDLGKVVLTDFMSVTSEPEKARRLWPEHELIRLLKCEAGEMPVDVDFELRPDYGRTTPFIENAGELGWRINIGPNLLSLRSDGKLVANHTGGLSRKLLLKTGQTIAFSLTFSHEGPAVLPPLNGLAGEKLGLTADWWRRWAERTKYDGLYREHVVRSALVLALLSYAPSGALVAAPTTSLPEKIGDGLNWDYRFCWLRDEALAVRALFGLGYHDRAEAFISWLLHTTRLTRPRLKPVYDVFGNELPTETLLSGLSGYAESLPVRISNAAANQLQNDIYGEVIQSVAHVFCEKKEIDRETQKMLRQYGDYVCNHWCEPDNGIWESRGPRRHYTHSRLLCWVALDRLADLHQRGQLRKLSLEKVTNTRDRIRNDIEQHAWNPTLHSYTQVLGGDKVDASLLLLGIYGFEDASSERMRQTHERLRRELSTKTGLMYRDNHDETLREGAFGICSFWEANFLAKTDLEEAHRVFENALEHSNDLGLFGEEIDPESGNALGNFPQALTHLALINAALSLRETA